MPVTVLISGNENATCMREKTALVRSFTKLSGERRMSLVEKFKNIALSVNVEYFKKRGGIKENPGTSVPGLKLNLTKPNL
jgi:hypothetical protein